MLIVGSDAQFGSIDRHNFGFVLFKRREIHLATATARLVFHLQLPGRLFPVDIGEVNCTGARSRNVNSETTCRNLIEILNTYRDMKIKISEHLKMQLDRVYDLLVDLPVSGRINKRESLWSDFLSSITGLATQADLDDLKDLMSRINSGLQKAVEVWKSGSSHFITALKVEKLRVDNINTLIKMQRSSIFELQQEILNLVHRRHERMLLWNHMHEMGLNYTWQLTEINALTTAVELLSMGKLAHYFVNHSTLAHALVNLENFLSEHHPELKLLRRDVQFYYKQPVFRAFRYLRFLLIIVEAPLTISELLHPMDLYYIHKLPLISPTAVNHYTILGSELQAVIYHRDVDYLMTFSNLLEIPDADIFNLKQSASLLQHRSIPSCGLAIFEGELAEIKKYCRYHLVKAPVPRSVLKINHNTFLLSNISSVTIKCLNQNISNTFTLSHIQAVFTVNCGCVLEADEFLAVATSLYCPLNDNLTISFEPRFLLNLPYLSEFVHSDVLNVLQQIDFLNDTIPIELPPLSIASKKYQANLGIEEHSKFDLEQIVNHTMEDQLAFDDLSHYVYSVLLGSHSHNKEFDYLNVLDWFLVLATIAGFLALLLAVILHFKVRTLFLILASSGRARAAPLGHVLPTAIYFSTNPVTTISQIDPLRYQKVIKDVFPVDVSILLCFILFIVGFVLYIFVRRRKRIHTKTTLILEIGDMETTFRWTVAKLAYSPGFYRIMVAQTDAIRLLESFMTLQIHWADGINIINTAINLPVHIITTVNVKFWNAFKVRALMNKPFYAVLQVLSNDDNLVDVILIKQMLGRASVGDVSQAQASMLYPTRDIELVAR